MKYLSLLPILLLVACSATPPAGNGQSSSSITSAAAHADIIVVDSPTPGQTVTSPLTVTGRARGPWYFEASFPVRILDDQGSELAIAPAQAQGDWMTEDWVPFTVTLSFTTTATDGTVVLQKDNPSGMPENDASVEIPVKF